MADWMYPPLPSWYVGLLKHLGIHGPWLPGAMAVISLFTGATILAPPARAVTVTVTYEYVYFAAGKHTRQPRNLIGSGFAPISSQPGGQLSSGLQFIPDQPPASQQVSAQTYDFAFVTVTGGSATSNGPPGGVTSTDRASPPTVYVETQPIVVLMVYVPVGGSGGVGSGAADRRVRRDDGNPVRRHLCLGRAR